MAVLVTAVADGVETAHAKADTLTGAWWEVLVRYAAKGE